MFPSHRCQSLEAYLDDRRTVGAGIWAFPTWGAPAPAPAPAPLPFPWQGQPTPAPAPVRLPQPTLAPAPAPALAGVSPVSIDAMIAAVQSFAQAVNNLIPQMSNSLTLTLQLTAAALSVQARRLQGYLASAPANGQRLAITQPTFVPLRGTSAAAQVNTMRGLSAAAGQLSRQIPFPNVSARLAELSNMLNNQAIRLLWQPPADTSDYTGR